MSPIQFSALKALDPLDQKPERGENHDGQTDIEEVPHGALLGVSGGVQGVGTLWRFSVKPQEMSGSPVQTAPMHGAMGS
jgi:hypothetical protein